MGQYADSFANIAADCSETDFMVGELDVIKSIATFAHEMSGDKCTVEIGCRQDTLKLGLYINPTDGHEAFIPFTVARNNDNKLVAEFTVDPSLKEGGVVRYDLSDEKNYRDAMGILAIEAFTQARAKAHTYAVMRHFNPV